MLPRVRFCAARIAWLNVLCDLRGGVFNIVLHDASRLKREVYDDATGTTYCAGDELQLRATAIHDAGGTDRPHMVGRQDDAIQSRVVPVAPQLVNLVATDRVRADNGNGANGIVMLRVHPPRELHGKLERDQVDAVNRLGADGKRMVRIHAVGFPFLFRGSGDIPPTAHKFSQLMRVLCERNGGTFVALTHWDR